MPTPIAALTALTIEEFEARFKPVKNHFNPMANYEGFAFETYGPEYEFVREMVKTNPDRVWTVVDGGESCWLTNGWHYVNRQFYVITELPCPEGEEFEIEY